MEMTPALFLLLCSWSWTPRVTGFTVNELKMVTDYIRKSHSISSQHAYVVKFDAGECRDMTEKAVKAALQDDMGKINKIDLLNTIYEGKRIIMTSFEEESAETVPKHAEYRLLYPNPKTGFSPVEDLLNGKPPAECVVFFTFLSPCIKYCTNPATQYYITPKLDQFCCINNRAFVYNKIYRRDNNSTKLLEERLTVINDNMPVYRCDSTCIQCFPNGRFRPECVRIT